MKEFLYDYNDGLGEGRYVNGSLPKLPFQEGRIRYCLCGNLLFIYGQVLSEEFHIQSIKELCRVSSEVRIYPLTGSLSSKRSIHLDPVLDKLSKDGYKAKIIKTHYKIKKDANEMLVIT